MSEIIKLELTEEEYNFLNDVLNTQIEKLKVMSSEERIDWYINSLFNKPINFTKEIDNTIYTVNTHFNDTANESVKEKVVRILEQNNK
jgi:hypothetical protein